MSKVLELGEMGPSMLREVGPHRICTMNPLSECGGRAYIITDARGLKVSVAGE